MTAAATDTLLDELRDAVGPTHLLTDSDLVASYAADWTGRFHGDPLAVARPANTGEVAAVLTACRAHRVAVTVQGGNTGLVGGGVPAGGDVLLSTTRLAGLEPVDSLAGQVTVGAGASLSSVQAHARAAGLDVGVDLAARDSASIGGMVATNAGGEHVLRYGSMRAQVLGVEAVLPDATVLCRLTGLVKDNTGYNLTGLLAGSEGTLAVLTRVRLRLVALLRERSVALVGLPDIGAALALLSAARDRLATLAAAEFFLADGLELVRAHTGLPAPLAEAHPVYLLLECADQAPCEHALLDLLGEADVADATVASDARGRAALWTYREAHTESVNALGVPVKLDVSVPLPALATAVAELPAAVAAAGVRVVLWGHLAEGNLHVNVLGAADDPQPTEAAVMTWVAAHGGSISAEHGVGRAKAAWLALTRSPAEIAAMRAVKTALDPDGLLGPGVLFPAG